MNTYESENKMTIRHLEIFRTVCRAGGATRAAEALGMTQPAVSIALRELESYYNTRLFDRVGRRLILTEAGETLRDCADSLLDGFEATAELLRDGGSFRRVRLGVNVSVGETLLCSILDELEREVAGIDIRVSVGNTREVERRLSEGELDLIVADCITRTPDREILPFHVGEAVVVCAKNYAAPSELTFAELCGERLLLREPQSGSRIGLEAIAGEEGCVIEPSVESSSDLCLIELARAGRGITILPRELVDSRLASGELREIGLVGTQLMRRYFLAYSSRRRQTPALREAIDILKRRHASTLTATSP